MLLLDDLSALLGELRPYLLTIANQELPDHLAAKVGASDLVQETCETAFRQRGQYRGSSPSELRAWLAQILRSRVLALRRRYLGASSRRATREVSLAGPADQAEGARQLADGSPSPCDTVITEERNGALRAAIASLPEAERRVIALRLEDELPFAAIGERLGFPETTVRRVFGRAVCLLQIQMQSHA